MDSTNNSNNIPSDVYEPCQVFSEEDETLAMFDISEFLMTPLPFEEPEIVPSSTLPNNSYQESYDHPQYPYQVPSQIGVEVYPQGPQQAENALNFFTSQDDYSLSYIFEKGNIASGSGFDSVSNSVSNSNSMNWANQVEKNVHNGNSGCASGGIPNMSLITNNAPMLNSSHETRVMPAGAMQVSNKRPFPTTQYYPPSNLIMNNPHFHQPKYQASARAMLPPRYVEKPYINANVGMNGNIVLPAGRVVPMQSHPRNIVRPYMNTNVAICRGNTDNGVSIGNANMYMQYNQFGGMRPTLNGIIVKQEVSNQQKGPIMVPHGVPPRSRSTRPAKGSTKGNFQNSAWTGSIKNGYIQFDSHIRDSIDKDVPATKEGSNNTKGKEPVMIPYSQPNRVILTQPNNPPPPPPPAQLVVLPEVKNHHNEAQLSSEDTFEPIAVNGKNADPLQWIENVPSDFFDNLKLLFPDVEM